MNFIPTIIAIGFVALAPNKLTAQGYIYDQQSSANPASVAGGFVIQAGSPAGQSFTPNLSGIGFVQFAFVDANSGNGIGATVYVNLHSTGIGGPILATTSPVFMPDTFGQITSNGTTEASTAHFLNDIFLAVGY